MKTLFLSLLLCVSSLAQSYVTMTSPGTGSFMTSSTQAFTWAGGINPPGWLFYASATGFLNYELAGVYVTTPTYTMTNVPSSGTLYITIWYQPFVGTTWYAFEASYQCVGGTLALSGTLDGTGPPPDGPDDYAPIGAPSNLAQGKPAAQSSTYSWTVPPVAAWAVDGNTDGEFGDMSVSHTNPDPNAWWQVDLGGSALVTSVNVWGRTNYCCPDRLSDYWVFVSDTPFGPSDTPSTLAGRAATYSNHQTTIPSPTVSIPFGGVRGRYVRVQLSGTNYLSLAEVQVMGTFVSGGGTTMMDRYKIVRGHQVERGDQINIGDLQYAHQQEGAEHVYAYTLDNRDAFSIRLGTFENDLGTRGEQPKGWIFLSTGWGVFVAEPETSKSATFKVWSANRPGPMPIHIQGDILHLKDALQGKQTPPGVPMTGKTATNEAIHREAMIVNNSVKRYVIGPAIPPEATKEEILQLVRKWHDEYGFSFLAPILEEGRAAISRIQPASQLERDILESLRAVL